MQLLQISLSFTLAICCSHIYAVSVLGKGRVHIASLNTTALSSEDTVQSQKQSVAEAITLNLPKGFKPQSSPLSPLLYPFVTEEAYAGDPATANDATTSGWKPIVNGITSIQHSTTYIPLLQDRVHVTSVESHQSTEEEGPIFESVVYGTWKPDPPLQPDKILDSLHKMINREHESTIEKLGLKHQIDENTNYSNSQESIEGRRSQSWLLKKPYEEVNSNKHTNKKYESQKITVHEADSFDRSKGTGYASIVEVINVNISDPKLLDIAKKINNSAETRTVPNKKKPTRRTTNWVSIGPTISATIKKQEQPKVWPTDFEQTTPIPAETEKSIYNFIGDSSEPPEALSDLNIPESFLPQIPVNITKMGIPYEEQNSSEEPTICVPLTVRETVNTEEILDVERVYCFPLPLPEIDVRAIGNDAAMNAKVNTLSDYAAINSTSFGVSNYKCPIILMSTVLLLVQFFIS